MRAIIYLYYQDNYINIQGDSALIDDGMLLVYHGSQLNAMFKLDDVKGFYLSQKGKNE